MFISKDLGTETHFASQIFTCRKQATPWGWGWGMLSNKGEKELILLHANYMLGATRTWHTFTLTSPHWGHPPPPITEQAPSLQPWKWQSKDSHEAASNFTPILSCTPEAANFFWIWPGKCVRLFEPHSLLQWLNSAFVAQGPPQIICKYTAWWVLTKRIHNRFGP